jgi:fructose-1,6-bisphosphatase I
MSSSGETLKLSKFLEKNLPHYLPNKGGLINLIERIAEASLPIRGLLEKGITSREIHLRMNIDEPIEGTKNIYDEQQIHEDILTHSIILKSLQEGNADYSFIASEEAPPIFGKGDFGITIDPVDGSSNVEVNRTVGTIVGIWENEQIVCALYILYGIFTNLILAINGKVSEFVLDTTPYSMTFYHYVFHDYLSMPDPEEGGLMCMGGDSRHWSEKCKKYEQLLIEKRFKNRYSGSFVSDFHAIINIGGVYSYFLQKGKAKLRLYFEWLPIAFIAKTLGGELLIVDEEDNVKTMTDVEPLTKENVNKIHSITCGSLIGSKSAVNMFLDV